MIKRYTNSRFHYVSLTPTLE